MKCQDVSGTVHWWLKDRAILKMSYKRNSTSELGVISPPRSCWYTTIIAPTVISPPFSWSRAVTFYFFLIIHMVCPPSLPGGFFWVLWSRILLRRGGKRAKGMMWSDGRKYGKRLTELLIGSPGRSWMKSYHFSVFTSPFQPQRPKHLVQRKYKTQTIKFNFQETVFFSKQRLWSQRGLHSNSPLPPTDSHS